jgi:hypothetical protein
MDKVPRARRQAEQYSRLRRRGRRHFILWRGVVFWGITTACFVLAINFWALDGQLKTISVVIPLIVFPVTGYFWAAWFWSWMERQVGVQDEDHRDGA